ncbi:uncharacterized protein LOC134841874 isoform X3 [Symsagittifera roscoffensis]|uniref:uncharacterized protein LOC134841874 isoform X3 n=1 Tax=Symsagittifera roscoffensis TaxID=84072 RepID=UPI00307B4D82
MDHQSTIETAILLGNQMDVNASATCAAESFITMGPFMTYSSHTQQPQTCTNSEEQQQKHNTMYHQQPIASTARSGNEMDILQAALHLADISEEELKAEELNTSLFPTQELQQDQGGGRGISSYTSLAQLQSTGLCMDPEYQCASSIYTNQSQPHLIPCQSSSIQQPGIVMTSQVQPQNSAVFAANAPSVAKKRKGSNSTGSSCSPNEGLPRPRGRPKSPKGAPKNTPKKKPQPFISTYNGQKVMYIPVPCPNNGETPVAPSSAMPPIITQNIPPFLSQSTVQLTPDQQPNTQPNISAKCQPVKVPTIKSKKTTCTKAQQKKLGIQLKQSMNIAVSKHNQGQLGTTNFIQPNSYIQSSVCSIEQSSVNSRNCPVVIAGSNAAKSQVIEFASSSSSLPADNSNSSDQPIKVQIMSQSNQQPTRIIQQHHQSISSRSANGMDPKLANGSMVNSQPVHVSTSGQNGIRLAPHQVSASNQTMQKLNIIASSIQPQSKGYQQTSRCQDQQPMITFQIVQNSKTGTIEFIPVGPSNGKTQIQIIPKPAQIQQHAIRVTTEAAETPKPFVTGLNNHVEGTAMKSIAMKVQDASLVQSSPKSMSKKKSAKSNAALQFPRKRGRPRNQPSNESKDAVDKISAALKSIGATVCPVGSLGSTHLVPKLCPGAELPPGNSSTMSIQSPCSSSQMTLHDSELSNFSNGEGAKDHLKKESPKALKKACDRGGASKKKSTKDSRSHSSQAVPPHVQGAINYEQNRVLAPDFSRCFERMRDATMRLLPYHVLQDLAFNEVFLEKERRS